MAAVLACVALGAAGAVALREPQAFDVTLRRHAALVEHEEGRGKRLRVLENSLARASAGQRPPSVEGADRGIDVLTYDVWFGIDPAVRTLEGRVTMRIVGVKEDIRELALDLDDGYAVTSTLRDGADVTPVRRGGGKLVLPIDPPLRTEGRATYTVAYRGAPPLAGALAYWQHDTGFAATSVAEPFGARDFWPCVDAPNDKAVMTVSATVPPGYVFASAGRISVTDEADGHRTFTWRLPQPVSTYLLALNVSNYTTIEDAYTRLDGRTMPVVSYVLPQLREGNVDRLAAMKKHLATLAALFGEYPFADTKYGIVASHFSGGMEHPTLTSIGANLLGSSGRDLTTLLVHELSHQWWGDTVTMRTWDDIWLNEGFATYAEVLYGERADGSDPGFLMGARDDGRYAGLMSSPVVANPADPFRFTGAVYQKGGWVLHMLRREGGDETFFAGLREWRRRHSWGTATRADLRTLYEEMAGRDFKQFFDQWVETPYRPTLRVGWRGAPDVSHVTFVVTQTQTHAVVHPQKGPDDVPWYRFPITLRLIGLDGRTAEVTLPVSGRATEEAFGLPNPLQAPISYVTVDPHNDLLKIVEAAGPY